MLTADVVLFGLIDDRLSTLLIRRKHDPFVGRWAFPGGFVDEYEPPPSAARRELKEETGVDVERDALRLFGVFGQRGRDPRGWTVTVSYYAIVDVEAHAAVAGDDAASVAWRPVRRTGPLAFDHRPMLTSALQAMRHDIYATSAAKPLLDANFPPSDLLEAYRRLDPNCPAGSELVQRLLSCGTLRKRSGSLCFS